MEKIEWLEWLECEVCLSMATDFYIICDNKHSFCWHCTGKIDSFCPKCRQPLKNNEQRDHKRNHMIQNILDEFISQLKFSVPVEVDAMDYDGNWFRGQVKKWKKDFVLVHYYGWHDRWNEWIHCRSGRLMPCGMHTSDWIKDIKVGQMLEFLLIKDGLRMWFVGVVVKVLPSGKNIMVQKQHGDRKIFKIQLNKERITHIGIHTPLSLK